MLQKPAQHWGTKLESSAWKIPILNFPPPSLDYFQAAISTFPCPNKSFAYIPSPSCSALPQHSSTAASTVARQEIWWFFAASVTDKSSADKSSESWWVGTAGSPANRGDGLLCSLHLRHTQLVLLRAGKTPRPCPWPWAFAQGFVTNSLSAKRTKEIKGKVSPAPRWCLFPHLAGFSKMFHLTS